MNHPDSKRDPLERLAEQFTHCLRCGEQPSVEEWASSHPDLSEQIRATFPGLVMMEELASREFSARQTTAVGTTALATLPVERIGDFRIVREVGRGGMGIVYEAVQESLGRRVALKVLPTPRRAGGSGLARFEREAAAAARLHHTNIVPVFAVGSEEDVCYYAMQFIDGEPLDRLLQQTEPERLRESDYARWVARVGRQVADGLEYAHSRGTLHRDIKPANLLIDEQQTVWITDFGVAQLADAEDLTIPGDVVGTLRYMSPEQLNGQADARSDVYSLGLTLYEMLTLRPAFGESSRTRLLRQISEAEPASLPKSNPHAPLDLVTVVAKAMAREPELRYPSRKRHVADRHRRPGAGVVSRGRSLRQGRGFVGRHARILR
ncbi:MAG: serine/threonine protein kinase, partial [Planctomycetes bacterium]|nr:serine/threonine protein kinase [Planctomycetota bacterium]